MERVYIKNPSQVSRQILPFLFFQVFCAKEWLMRFSVAQLTHYYPSPIKQSWFVDTSWEMVLSLPHKTTRLSCNATDSRCINSVENIIVTCCWFHTNYCLLPHTDPQFRVKDKARANNPALFGINQRHRHMCNFKQFTSSTYVFILQKKRSLSHLTTFPGLHLEKTPMQIFP